MRHLQPTRRAPRLGANAWVALAALIGLGTLGCTWVELTPSGRDVKTALPEEVQGCQKVGQTRTSVVSRLVFVDRSHTKVAQELTTLARNEAPGLGGNTVVASSPIERGTQSFEIYLCER